MKSEKGLELHRQAEHTREAGEFQKSVELARQAIKIYEQDQDFLGASDACGSLCLSLRHLGQLEEAEKASLEGIKIAEEHNLGGDRARLYFNLAKVQEDLGKFSDAVPNYRKSIEVFTTQNPSLHNRTGVLADMKIHEATCEYKLGEKSGLERALVAIEDLKNSDERNVLQYNYDVWLSGGYMRIAEILKNDDRQKAKEYLGMAKEVIDANSDLKIRKEQWEKLSKTFNV